MQLGPGVGILRPLTILTALTASPLRVLGSIEPQVNSTSKSLTGFQTLSTSTISSHIPHISDDILNSIQPRATKVGRNNAETLSSSTSSNVDTVETAVVDDVDSDDEDDAPSGNGPVATGGKTGCFSLETSFLEILEDSLIRTIPLNSLKEGDQVVVGHAKGEPVVQPFSGDYFHRNTNEHFDFVKLTTQDNSQLTVTRNHYLLAEVNGKQIPVMAGSLRLGDKLLKDGKPVEIHQVEATKEKGAASPIFEKGSLEVNGFSVSTYAGLRLGDIDLLGYTANSHIIDTAAGLTKRVQGADALKPNQENEGQVQALGQNVLDALHL